MSQAEIVLTDEFRPVDLGYSQKEKTLRRVLIILTLVMVFLFIAIFTVTIFLSCKQKWIRLQYYAIEKDNERLKDTISGLKEDRQVILELKY